MHAIGWRNFLEEKNWTLEISSLLMLLVNFSLGFINFLLLPSNQNIFKKFCSLRQGGMSSLIFLKAKNKLNCKFFQVKAILPFYDPLKKV